MTAHTHWGEHCEKCAVAGEIDPDRLRQWREASHNHQHHADDCYRCDLGRDEAQR